jgi:hypothetical protein
MIIDTLDQFGQCAFLKGAGLYGPCLGSICL